MSETLDLKTAQPGSAPPRSKALRRIAIALSLVAIVVLALAGVPSLGVTPMPRVKNAIPRDVLDLTRSDELAAGFADLAAPVEAATGQRPVYPTTGQLAERLEGLPDWQMAVLFALDATPAELFAAGVSDPDVCMVLNPAPMPESVPMLRHWKLALMDADQRVVGTTLLEVPAPGVERLADETGRLSGGPALEARFPDWPRAVVFKRAAGGAQLDG